MSSSESGEISPSKSNNSSSASASTSASASASVSASASASASASSSSSSSSSSLASDVAPQQQQSSPGARDPPPNKPVSQLHSASHSYAVQSILREGTFGEVVKCIRKDTNKMVVVKMIKNNIPLKDAKEEVAILNKLRSLAPLAEAFVWLNHSFVDRGRLCLEFDLLDISLWDMMKRRHFMPLSLQNIRGILQQLATGLQYLKTFGIIHADVKSSNIMIVDRGERPFRVKIIDFGKAYDMSHIMNGSGIQSLLYRSPEIMLGLPCTEAIDMWSLGCVAAHLYLGFYLFCGEDEYQMLRAIVTILGQPPDDLLQSGQRTTRFFTTSTKQHRRLKTPEEFYIHPELEPAKKELRVKLLDDLSNFNQSSPKTKEEDILGDLYDRWLFVDLMKGILHLDATTRLTPTQVLQHSFFVRRVTAVMYDLRSPGHSQPPISRAHPVQKNSQWTHSLRNYGSTQYVHQQKHPYTSSRTHDEVRHHQPPMSRAHPVQKNSQWIHPERKSGPTKYVHQQTHPYTSSRTHDEVRHRQHPISRVHPAQKNSQWTHSLRNDGPTQYVHQQTHPHTSSRRCDKVRHRQPPISRAHSAQGNISQWIHPARNSGQTQFIRQQTHPYTSRRGLDKVRHRQPPISRAHPAHGNIPQWIHPARKGDPTQYVRQQTNSYTSSRTHDEVRHGQPSISRAHPAQENISWWIHPARRSSRTQYPHQQTNPYTSSRTQDEVRHGQTAISRAHPAQENISWWIHPARRSGPTQHLHQQTNPYTSSRRHNINRTQATLASRLHWKI